MAVGKIRRTIRIVGALIGVAFVGWNVWAFGAQGFDRALLDSDARVNVRRESDRISFIPTLTDRTTGVIFLPGAMVDPLAYAPLAREVAAAGYNVVILELPFRLAPLESQRTELLTRVRLLIDRSPTVAQWVLAGHSRGGALATEFITRLDRGIVGLVLIGTSHPRERDLTGVSVPITKIYGTRDGLASEEEVETFAVHLPQTTRFVRIEGGNHAQFGWYGPQLGDKSATISRVDQQEATVAALLQAIREAEQKSR